MAALFFRPRESAEQNAQCRQSQQFSSFVLPFPLPVYIQVPALPALRETDTSVSAAKAVKAVRTKVADTVLEVEGLSVSIPEVETAVKKHAADNGLKGDINIYLNVTEKAAYYTVNGNGGEGQKVLFSEI